MFLSNAEFHLQGTVKFYMYTNILMNSGSFRRSIQRLDTLL